jgi:GNAT superfamily N-acetyltransferase
MGSIETVTKADMGDLLPLMRAYCDYYKVDPSRADLEAMSRALIADPKHEGFQLIARNGTGRAVGFATVFWSWSTLSASRIGVMNDLFVDPSARGEGIADALIGECAQRVRDAGGRQLEWQTARDNTRAQTVYERVGGERSDRWLDYSMDL